MKNKHSHLATLFLVVCILMLGRESYAKDYEIVEETNYARDYIGRSYKFDEEMVYLIIPDSNKDAITKNGGIERILTRSTIAKFNKKSQKISVSGDMTFRLIKVLKTIHTNLDEWGKAAREAYSSFSKANPDIDMLFVVKDHNGIISTVMSGTFRRGKLIDNANKSLNTQASPAGTPQSGAH